MFPRSNLRMELICNLENTSNDVALQPTNRSGILKIRLVNRRHSGATT